MQKIIYVLIISIVCLALSNSQAEPPAFPWPQFESNQSRFCLNGQCQFVILQNGTLFLPRIYCLYSENGKAGGLEEGLKIMDLSRNVRFYVPGFDGAGKDIQRCDLMPMLRNIFQNEDVPEKLAWIAEVESSMNPEAESCAGALGLYQLMPETAQRFGLSIFPVDDRLTPEKNAKAAASYLRQLKKEFGCWALALAAYNAGEGKVMRIMKLHGARSFRELAPHLPAETRQYVPRVLTIIALREDQRRGLPAAVYMR
jgi:hypothetical protein